ncbi:MAG: SDR family oxidoreductase [Acidimicrobiales bacterium]
MTSFLQDRVVVITGGGGGFGRLIGEQAAARGARVVLADRDGAAAKEAAAAIEAAGGVARAETVDVTDAAQMDAMAASTVAAYGAIDVMVNNAGVMPLAFFADHQQARDAWYACIDINLKGVLNGICAVHDQMIGQGRGHVVNVSSIYANAGTAGSGVYSATKAAVAVLSESLRVESQGTIKVTIVRPTGVMGTGLGAGVVNPAAIVGLAGQNAGVYAENVEAYQAGTLPPTATDRDEPGYWAITPDIIADQVIHAIDQPWGIDIGDVTIRATGENWIL